MNTETTNPATPVVKSDYMVWETDSPDGQRRDWVIAHRYAPKFWGEYQGTQGWYGAADAYHFPKLEGANAAANRILTGCLPLD